MVFELLADAEGEVGDARAAGGERVLRRGGRGGQHREREQCAARGARVDHETRGARCARANRNNSSAEPHARTRVSRWRRS